MMDHSRDGRWTRSEHHVHHHHQQQQQSNRPSSNSSLGQHQQHHHHQQLQPQYQRDHRGREVGYQSESYVREGQSMTGRSMRWGPISSSPSSRSSTNTTEEDRNNSTYKKVRGILNKLTPEKFDKLSSDLILMRLDSPTILKGVILLIHDKALEEPKYSSMYAQLCKKLSRDIPNVNTKGVSDSSPRSSLSQQQPQSQSGTSSPGPASDNMFCKFLLVRCQEEFDNRLKASERFKDILAERQQQQLSPCKTSDSNGNTSSSPSSVKSKSVVNLRLSEEEEEQRNIAKSKMLGNIKFIAELGRHGLIPEGIIHKCILQLLSRRSSEPIASKSDDLECLCQIMKTVGRQLDSNDKARNRMDQYFQKIKEYSANTELPSRIRFMLQDVIELRENQWLPRRVQKDLGPRTIHQVREEAARDLGIPNPIYFDFNSATALQLQGVFGNNHGPGLASLSGSIGPFGSSPHHPIGRTGQLYGHPSSSLVGSQGQRALDDMGYYANSHSNIPFLSGPPPGSSDSFLERHNQERQQHQPRVGMERESTQQHPHTRGHMPYRGSSSQDDPRNDQNRQKPTDNSQARNQGPPRSREQEPPRQIHQRDHQQLSSQRQQFPPPSGQHQQRRDFEGGRSARNVNLTSLGGPASQSSVTQQPHNVPPRLQSQRHTPYDSRGMQQQPPYQQQYHQQHHQYQGRQQQQDRYHDQRQDRHFNPERHEGRGDVRGQGHGARGGPPLPVTRPPQMSHSVVPPQHHQHQQQQPTHPSTFLSPSSLQQSSRKQDISLRPAENSMVVLKPSHFGPKPGSLSDPASNARQQQQQSQPPVLQTPEAAAVPEEKKVNHKEVLLKKTESIMEELMKPSPNDDEQVVEEVAQVKSPSIDDISLQLKSLKIPKNHASDVVEVVIKSTLSKTDRDRENASQLLINLKKEGVVSNTVFISAIRGLLNKLKQLEVDDPLVKTHLSEFIARAVASDILTVVESLEVVNSHYPMFLLILQQLREIKGREWLSSSIESHKINLMTVLPEADRNKEQLCDILENRGLSFLLPLLRVESDLKKLLLQDSPPASILKWIKDTVEASLTSSKPFIVILFTAVVDFIVTKSSVNQDEKKQADSEKEMIKSFSKLLKAFVFDKPSLQLTGLYALQTLCHQLKFPKGMLLRWFNALYDLEVIEDEVFLRWKEDINDDFPGKGQALFQVNTWLIWLAEVEEEEEEEEDDEPEEEVREEDNNGIHRNDN